jgi:hypothetical protein
MCVKLSILVLYLRLSPEKRFRTMVHAVSVCVVMYSLVASFGFLFACKPIAKTWDLTITYGSCIDVSRIWTFSAVMNSATDIFILSLPIIMMWHVKIQRRRKIGVIAILMVGGL